MDDGPEGSFNSQEFVERQFPLARERWICFYRRKYVTVGVAEILRFVGGWRRRIEICTPFTGQYTTVMDNDDH